MRRYLARKYVMYVAIVMLILWILLRLAESSSALFQAAFWAGPVAMGVTYWQFRRYNVWVLFDNLRYSAWGYLVGYTLAYEVCVLGSGSILG
jgi:hypothetical protein